MIQSVIALLVGVGLGVFVVPRPRRRRRRGATLEGGSSHLTSFDR